MEDDAIKGALAALGWLPDELLMQAQIHRNDPDSYDAPMKPTEAAAILDSFCMPFTHRDAQRAGVPHKAAAAVDAVCGFESSRVRRRARVPAQRCAGRGCRRGRSPESRCQCVVYDVDKKDEKM